MCGQLRAYRVGLQGLAICLLPSSAWGGAVPAQDLLPAASLAQRFNACPVVGVQAHITLDLGVSPSLTGEADTKEDEGSVDTIWPDSDSARPPEAVLLAEESWVAPPSALDRHQALRARLGRPMPQGTFRIMIFEHSRHWTAVESSSIAVRQGNGVWRVDSVRQINVGSNAVQSAAWAETLSYGDGARLDALLADSCLDAEPLATEWSPLWSSTQARWVLEIEAPASTRRIAGADFGFGRAGAIRHLLSANLNKGP